MCYPTNYVVQLYLRLEINRFLGSRNVSSKLVLVGDLTAPDDNYSPHIHCCNGSQKSIIGITKVSHTGFMS
jgi:hypothetical protein